jgi:hypothetical protein
MLTFLFELSLASIASWMIDRMFRRLRDWAHPPP